MKLESLIPPLGWVSALLGAGITSLLLQVSGPVDRLTEQSADPALPDAQSAGSDLMLPPPSDVEAAVEVFTIHPLFAEGRKTPEPLASEPAPLPEPEPVPVEPVEKPAEVQPPEPPQLLLIGMMETEGRRRVLIRDLVSGEERWIAEGDVIGDWTLAKITQDGIRLEVEGAETTFNLFEDRLP